MFLMLHIQLSKKLNDTFTAFKLNWKKKNSQLTKARWLCFCKYWNKFSSLIVAVHFCKQGCFIFFSAGCQIVSLIFVYSTVFKLLMKPCVQNGTHCLSCYGGWFFAWNVKFFVLFCFPIIWGHFYFAFVPWSFQTKSKLIHYILK